MRREASGLRVVLAAAVALGCGGPEGEAVRSVEEEPDRPASEEPVADASAPMGADSDAAVGPIPGSAVDGGADGEGPLQPLGTYRLLLVNPGGQAASVWADAGAGRVLLERVGAGDSARVDVRLRASRLWLEATDPGGRFLGGEALSLSEGELLRWRVPRAGGGGESPRR